jgi:hypothetical protein
MTTMTSSNETLASPHPQRHRSRWVRWTGHILLGLLALIVLLGVSGASYEAIMATGDARRYPPPGQLVDVGGYRMHVHCVGQGSPTVVLDAGLGAFSLDWGAVQPQIATSTRAKFGLVRLLWAPAWPSMLPGSESLSPDTRTAIGVLQARPQQIENALAEGQARFDSNILLGTAAPLGDTPLLVLASAQSIDHLPFWKEAQQIMTGLPSNSRLVVASSGHAIHFGQPALVVESIRQVVDAARTGKTL